MGKCSSWYFVFFILIASSTLRSETKHIPDVVFKTPHYSHPNGPQHIITQEQIATAGISNLSEALQNLGGVQIQDMLGNGAQVSMSLRGFGANATSNALLLINGIPITNPDLAAPNLNIIPIPNIAYIEIIAGSESVLYGDQAVDGVINIITNKNSKDNIVLSCQSGSYYQYACYLAAVNANPIAPLGLTLSHYQTRNYRQHNDYDQTTLLGRLDFARMSDRFFMNWQLAKENMQYPGGLSLTQVREDRRQANNDIDFFNNQNGLLLLQHQHDFSSALLKTGLAYRFMNGNGCLTFPFTQSRQLFFFKQQFKKVYSTTILTSGIDVQVDHYRLGSSFGLTDERQQKWGAFILHQISPNPYVGFTLGLRLAAQLATLMTTQQKTKMLNRATASTIGANWHPSKNLNFYLRRACSFRFPKADENAFVANNVTYLRTQRGSSYEVGGAWQNALSLWKIDFYQLYLRDEISFDPLQTPLQPFGANTNLAPTVRTGAVFSGKLKLGQRLSLDSQLNMVRARFQQGINAKKRIPLVSECVARAGLNYAFNENISLYTEAVFTGNQYAANDNFNAGGSVGGYTLYHVNLAYRLKKVEAALRVSNVFNKYYYFYAVYQPGFASELYYPAPTRQVLFTLKISFG